jgi:hypothetical protein
VDIHQAPGGVADEALVQDDAEYVRSVSLEGGALGAWAQEYRLLPSASRLGICCSGGGIRSASYCLGALQVLRDAGVLEEAKYLASVSGGGYISIGHFAVVGATYAQFGGDAQADAIASFDEIAAFAPNSPEERNLRDNSSYLARGTAGRLWLLLNLIVGVVRHLSSFAACLLLASSIVGFALHPWLGEALREGVTLDGGPIRTAAWWAGGLAVAAGICLLIRQFEQNGRGRAHLLLLLQSITTKLIGAAFILLVLLVGLPLLLWFLATRMRDLLPVIPTALTGVGGIGSAVLTYLAKRGVRERLVKVLLAIAAPLLVLAPFVGLTYWVAQQGLHLHPAEGGQWLPMVLVIVALLLLFAVAFSDEVTATMHLFYRERLAKAFVGRRRKVGTSIRHEEPPWELPLSFSKVERASSPGAKLPKLVICAAVNLSEDSVPVGRNGASFTFEQDFSGGPATGYVRTADLEDAAGEEVLTLPGLVAMSGAALAPSMGKMTRPALRLVMAMFNVRLGVWLPNPMRMARFPTPAAIRAGEERQPDNEPVTGRSTRLGRPGALYMLREALGHNSLSAKHVYITDGGHWENLGFVELLRRGCGQVLCFDAAGDDLEHFNTLSEAIALARSDLGVEIRINLKPLRPKDGVSAKDTVRGTIRYPDTTEGTLIFAKAAMTRSTPQDALAYRDVDPKFPTHPTSDQFFDERKFESYRSIGGCAARNAVVRLNVVRAVLGQSTFSLEEP